MQTLLQGVGGPCNPIHHIPGDATSAMSTILPLLQEDNPMKVISRKKCAQSISQQIDTLSRTAEIMDTRKKNEAKHPAEGILKIICKEMAALCRVTKYRYFY